MKTIIKITVSLFFICIILFTIHKQAIAQTQPNLNSYSLSFAPIHNWFPTANNTVQQIDAAVWKDGDGENVKNFTDIQAEWKFDPNFYQMKDTSSNYFQVCPIENVGKRPCIKFSVHVVTLTSGKTNVQLTLRNASGGMVWNAEPALIDALSQGTPTPTISSSGLSTYSLSFESDPIRKWWPIPANHYEDVAVGLWKDNDGSNVKRFTNLQAEWQFDPQYVTVAYTSSRYFDQCPVPIVKKRPCIYFYASITPNKAGNTSVQLKVKDGTGEEVWNAYPMIIEDKSAESVPTTKLEQDPSPTISASPVQIPSGSEYKNLEQKVIMLEKQVREQDVKLGQTQNLLDRILAFIQRVFNFR